MLLRKKYPFGIDISDRSIKVAQLEKGGDGLALSCYSRREIPAGVLEEGEIRNESVFLETLQKAIQEVKGVPPQIKKCVVSLPESESFVHMVSLPQMKKDELEEAIRWEAEAHIPYQIEDVYLDWQIIRPLKKTPGKLSVLIGAMPKKIVDDYAAVFKKTEFQPIVFEIESIATARALIKNSYSEDPLMLIDLGADRTSFIIFSGQTIIFTASSPFSNLKIVHRISETLEIDPREALEMKVRQGLSLKENPKLKKILESELGELVLSVEKYLNYFRSHPTPEHSNRPLISKIILCGGGANLAGLDEFLQEKLHLPVDIGNPWVNILKPPISEVPEIPYEESIAFTTALGLALRGIKEDD